MKRVSLNSALVLERPERVSDGAGGFSESWIALGTLWGAVQARSGRLATGQTDAVSVTGYRITVRGAPAGQTNRPEAGQRFRMGERLFRIEAVSEDGPRAMYLICHCEEEITP